MLFPGVAFFSDELEKIAGRDLTKALKVLELLRERRDLLKSSGIHSLRGGRVDQLGAALADYSDDLDVPTEVRGLVVRHLRSRR